MATSFLIMGLHHSWEEFLALATLPWNQSVHVLSFSDFGSSDMSLLPCHNSYGTNSCIEERSRARTKSLHEQEQNSTKAAISS